MRAVYELPSCAGGNHQSPRLTQSLLLSSSATQLTRWSKQMEGVHGIVISTKGTRDG